MNFAPFAFRNSGATSAYDANAQAFITAAGITDTTQKNAVNQLVLDLKSNSLWSKMYIIYPFIGGTSTTCKFNLMNPADTDAAYRLTFNGGLTFATTGVDGNGSNGYANTYWNPNVFNGTTSITGSLCLGVYSRTNSTGEDTEFGNSNGGQPAIQILCKRGSGNCIVDNYSSDQGRINTAVTNSQGFFVTSRTSTTSHKLFRNGTQQGSTNTTSQSTGNITLLNYNLYLFAQNNAGSAGSYSNRELAWMHVCAGLSDAEVSTLNTIVTTYQTSLSRNV
jgi:hypothetical protein